MAERASASTSRINDLTKRLQAAPGSRLFFDLAREHHAAGRLEDAARICRDGLQKHSSYHSARVLLGRVLIEQRKYGDALPELQLVVRQAPDNLMARRLLADALAGADDTGAALEVLRALASLAPGDDEVARRIGELEARRQGDATVVVAAPAAAAEEPPPPPRAAAVEEIEEEEPDEAAAQDAAPAATVAPPEPPQQDGAPPAAPPRTAGIETLPGYAPTERREEEPEPAVWGGAAEVRPAPAEPAPTAELPSPEPAASVRLEGPEDAPTQALESPEPAAGIGRESPEPAAGPREQPAPAAAAEARPPAPREEAEERGGPPAASTEEPSPEEQARTVGALPTPTLAEIYVTQGMPERALEIYRKVLEGDPDNQEVMARVRQLQARLQAAESGPRRRIRALEGWLARIRRSAGVQSDVGRGGAPPAGM